MQEYQSKLSEWGQWFAGFISSSDEVVDAHVIAERVGVDHEIVDGTVS